MKDEQSRSEGVDLTPSAKKAKVNPRFTRDKVVVLSCNFSNINRFF